MTSMGSGSKLVPIGVLFIILGFGLPVVLQRSIEMAMTLPIALAIDGFHVAFFVGLALLVIGLLRNRKQRKSENALPR